MMNHCFQSLLGSCLASRASAREAQVQNPGALLHEERTKCKSNLKVRHGFRRLSAAMKEPATSEPPRIRLGCFPQDACNTETRCLKEVKGKVVDGQGGRAGGANPAEPAQSESWLGLAGLAAPTLHLVITDEGEVQGSWGPLAGGPWALKSTGNCGYGATVDESRPSEQGSSQQAALAALLGVAAAAQALQVCAAGQVFRTQVQYVEAAHDPQITTCTQQASMPVPLGPSSGFTPASGPTRLSQPQDLCCMPVDEGGLQGHRAPIRGFSNALRHERACICMGAVRHLPAGWGGGHGITSAGLPGCASCYPKQPGVPPSPQPLPLTTPPARRAKAGAGQEDVRCCWL